MHYIKYYVKERERERNKMLVSYVYDVNEDKSVC